MQQKLVVCLLVFFSSTMGNAQFNRLKQRDHSGETYVRLNLLGMMDIFDGNVSFGGEHRLSNQWSLTLDAGYIFYSVYTKRIRQTAGVILRPAIRKYIGESERVFLDLQFHYKNVTYHIKDSLQHDPGGGGATFNTDTMFHFHR